jgi:hypothetical protein
VRKASTNVAGRLLAASAIAVVISIAASRRGARETIIVTALDV